MGQILAPTENEISGPWLIDKKALEELNACIETIEPKLDQAYEIAIEKETHEYINRATDKAAERGVNRELNFETEKGSIKKSITNRKSEKFAEINTQQGKTIRDTTLLLLLKDSRIDDFNPKSLNIKIRKGQIEFSLKIKRDYSDTLTYKVNVPDDDIFYDIQYEINKWIDKHKPNILVKKWSSWFPGAAFFFVFASFFIIPFYLTNSSDIYKAQLSQEEIFLIKDGLTQDEIPKAIELLLKKDSGYLPANYKPGTYLDSSIKNAFIFLALALMMLMIRPKTIIGLGKNSWKVFFYQKWIYFILVFIPLSILLPIILSKMG